VTVLEAGPARVDVRPEAGGRLAGLAVDGMELLVSDAASPLEWGCYPMVPWVGRMRGGQFAWGGQAHSLPVNFGAHAIHGTVWDVPWDESEPGVLDVALGPPWPYPGRVRHTVALEPDRLMLTLEVHATSTPMPVVVGWHPWWRRQLDRGEPLHVDVDLIGARMYRRDPDGIPSGELVAPSPRPWDDCFTGLSRPPLLRWPGAIDLMMDTRCDHWVIFDERPHAICVEPQTGPPDAFNLGTGFAVATPATAVTASWTIRWSGA
jgi:aldose 1-epimerase